MTDKQRVELVLLVMEFRRQGKDGEKVAQQLLDEYLRNAGFPL
jgi:hypothetical protein